MKYKALVTEEIEENEYSHSIKELDTDDLPNNNTLIRVHWSSLNYKDALSAKGHKGITREYPHTPGVDAAGKIIETDDPRFKEGDFVIVTGHDLGMNTSGGIAEYIRVPSEWLVPLPDGLTLRQSMIYGTAGVTAAICVNELIKHEITSDKGYVLVSGATGGVGSMSIAILNRLGYPVTASTGKSEQQDYLESLGAEKIIPREEVFDTSGKPLLKKRWAGAIDTVGGNTLSTIFRSTDHHGAVCVLGLVESADFNTNLYPFILRGVTLIGIDSAERGISIKRNLWKKLADAWKPKNLDDIAKEVSLMDIEPELDKILAGKQVGRVLINCKVS